MKYKPAVTPYLEDNIIVKDGRYQAKYGTFPTKELAQKKCDELNQIKTIVTSNKALDKLRVEK